MEGEKKMELPRFVALKVIHSNKYLRYIHEAGRVHGFLRFSEKVVSSPYAKLEVRIAKTSNNGKQFVYIKCCFNNKYLVRESEDKWWIVAESNEPEEDQSKSPYMLFEVLFLDGAIHPSIENVNKKIRFRHVQLSHCVVVPQRVQSHGWHFVSSHLSYVSAYSFRHWHKEVRKVWQRCIARNK
ncbi:hypothetical protein CsSME_00021717 [Camellia sinensis var. sinensis]